MLRNTVGGLLLRRLEKYIVNALPLQADVPQKPPRKSIKMPRSEGIVLRVVLRGTIIFPGGGGQPSGVGYTSVGPDMALEVFETKRVEGHAIRYIRFPTTDELRKAQVLLFAATNVIVTLGNTDYRRRLDHVSDLIDRLPRFLYSSLQMTLQTSQHLLSTI